MFTTRCTRCQALHITSRQLEGAEVAHVSCRNLQPHPHEHHLCALREAYVSGGACGAKSKTPYTFRALQATFDWRHGRDVVTTTTCQVVMAAQLRRRDPHRLHVGDTDGESESDAENDDDRPVDGAVWTCGDMVAHASAVMLGVEVVMVARHGPPRRCVEWWHPASFMAQVGLATLPLGTTSRLRSVRRQAPPRPLAKLLRAHQEQLHPAALPFFPSNGLVPCTWREPRAGASGHVHVSVPPLAVFIHGTQLWVRLQPPPLALPRPRHHPFASGGTQRIGIGQGREHVQVRTHRTLPTMASVCEGADECKEEASAARGYLSLRLSPDQCVPFAAATRAWRAALPPSLRDKIDAKPQKLHFTVLTDTSGDKAACQAGVDRWWGSQQSVSATALSADMGTTTNVFFLRFDAPRLEALSRQLHGDTGVNPQEGACAHKFFPPHLTLAWFASPLDDAERALVEQVWAQLAPSLPRLQLTRDQLVFKPFKPKHAATQA